MRSGGVDLLAEQRIEHSQEVQQARHDADIDSLRTTCMTELRQPPSTWTSLENYHALSIHARLKEEDMICFAANNRGDLAEIGRYMIRLLDTATDDHMDEYMADMD